MTACSSSSGHNGQQVKNPSCFEERLLIVQQVCLVLGRVPHQARMAFEAESAVRALLSPFSPLALPLLLSGNGEPPVLLRFMNIMTNNSLGQVANLRQAGGQ